MSRGPGGRRRGFTLTELLLLGAAMTVLSVVLLPRAYASRMRLNEEQAQSYLEMIRSAQVVWYRDVGMYRPVGRLVIEVPRRPDSTGPNLRTTLLPRGFLPYSEENVGQRGGYRFQGGFADAGLGELVGCWAWPNLPDYSGVHSYWIDYRDGRMFRTTKQPDWKTNLTLIAPSPGELEQLEPVSRD